MNSRICCQLSCILIFRESSSKRERACDYKVGKSTCPTFGTCKGHDYSIRDENRDYVHHVAVKWKDVNSTDDNLRTRSAFHMGTVDPSTVFVVVLIFSSVWSPSAEQVYTEQVE